MKKIILLLPFLFACGDPVCGNTIVEEGEACDDGNADPADGCDNECKTNGCANGVATPGELCFSPKTPAPIDGEQPSFIRHGDFNGDSFVDLALLDQAENNLSVVLNDTDGNFPQLRITTLAGEVRELAIADFDGDGDDDIAAGRPDIHVAQIFISNGDGTFAAPVDVEVFVSVAFLLTLDFDGDGDFDLMADGVDTVNGGEAITLIRNNGDGTFAAPERTALDRPFGFVAQDFNADGLIDLAVAKPINNEVEVLIGQAIGGFFSLVTEPTGTQPEQMFASQVDAGGNIDLLAFNRGTNDFSLILGEGNGTFENEQRFTPTEAPFEMALGEINQDARPEVFMRLNNRLQIFFGQGGFFFQDPIDIFTNGIPKAIDVVDVNNDGFDDLLIAFGSDDAAVTPSVVQAFLSKP